MASPTRKKYSSDRRQRMRELQAEGKLTPEHGKLGGRPPKVPTEDQSHPRPAAAAVRRAAAANADKIAAVFIDVLESDASDAQKVRSMRALLDVEQREVGIELEERKLGQPAPPAESREELVADLAAKLRENPIVRAQLLGALAAGPPPEGNSPKAG